MNKPGRRPIKNKWGNWVLDDIEQKLLHVKSRYEIDLQGIQDDADMVDWIFEVVNKNWSNRTDLGDMLYAFNSIIEPHSHLNITARVSENIIKRGKHNEF